MEPNSKSRGRKKNKPNFPNITQDLPRIGCTEMLDSNSDEFSDIIDHFTADGQANPSPSIIN